MPEHHTCAICGETGRVSADYIDHPVIDSTGLQGAWDFALTWTSRAAYDSAIKSGETTQRSDTASAVVPNGSLSLFEAIDKELGLKLELQRGPMPVVVLDHVKQKPTEN